jgi:hypothetical protein
LPCDVSCLLTFVFFSCPLSLFSSLSSPLFSCCCCKIGEVSTPWPAFSLVASNSGHFLSGEDSRATDMFRHRFLPALAEGAAFFKANTMAPARPALTVGGAGASILNRDDVVVYDSDAVCDDSVSLIMKRFGHQKADAARWLERTQYALPDMSVDAERMRRALQTLQSVGLVPPDYPVRRLWGGSSDSGSSGDNTTTVHTPAGVPCNDAITFRHTAPTVLPSAMEDEKSKMDELTRSVLML